MILRTYLFVGILKVTLETMQMDMRDFMVVENLEDIINLEIERILEFAVAHSLVVSNSLFTKRESHLVTYQSGEASEYQISALCESYPNEECLNQHKLLACDAKIAKTEYQCKKFVSKRCVRKLQQADFYDTLCEIFTDEMNDTAGEQVDDIWSRFTLCY